MVHAEKNMGKIPEPGKNLAYLKSKSSPEYKEHSEQEGERASQLDICHTVLFWIQQNTMSCYKQQKAINRFIVLIVSLWLLYGEQIEEDQE